MGIEPTTEAWEAAMLPLHQGRLKKEKRSAIQKKIRTKTIHFFQYNINEKEKNFNGGKVLFLILLGKHFIKKNLLPNGFVIQITIWLFSRLALNTSISFEWERE